MQLSLLWTDQLLLLLTLGVIFSGFRIARYEHLRAPWRQVGQQKLSMIALIVMLSFVGIGLLDAIHFHIPLPGMNASHASPTIKSALDLLVAPLGVIQETTYTAPFAHRLANTHNLFISIGITTLLTVIIWLTLAIGIIKRLAHKQSIGLKPMLHQIYRGKTVTAWREILLTSLIMLLLTTITVKLSGFYHILGTDKVGQDVFYQTLKSIHTALIIGSLTTLFILPFAIFLGISAGYFGGRVDTLIQYIYTTLSAVPGVLLISAAVLSLDVFINNHADQFPTIAQRADTRLLALCVILGFTSWTPLCRLLRGEALKIREMDYIHAAIVLGVNRFRIITRHILPNVMPIVLITAALDFSAFILAEAVLSYIGIGVDPSTMSWGNMINAARLELSRDPVVWWPLFAAFLLMFTLILATNLFADAVRHAFNPKTRHVMS